MQGTDASERAPDELCPKSGRFYADKTGKQTPDLLSLHIYWSDKRLLLRKIAPDVFSIGVYVPMRLYTVESDGVTVAGGV